LDHRKEEADLVFLSIPAEDWDQPSESVATLTVASEMRSDPAGIDQIASRMAACARPAFIVGAAVDRGNAWTQTVELAKAHNAHVDRYRRRTGLSRIPSASRPRAAAANPGRC